MVKFIEKRDGRIVEFDKSKIYKAVVSAMTKDEIDLSIAEAISIKISEKRNKTLNIETVQDLVVESLKKYNLLVTAKSYENYREERTRVRNKNNKDIANVKNILECNNIQNANANVDEFSFGGRKNESSNIIQKSLALSHFIDDKVAKAHNENTIYIHDLSEYGIGDHNCLFADVGFVLANGFEAANGGVRPANRLSTACQLVAVIFQIQSQVQFGGVASGHIDYDLAPYVKKSFCKHYINGLKYLENNVDIEKFKKDKAKSAKCNFDEITITHRVFRANTKVYEYAMDMLEQEGKQSLQALYHNLNTLESRAGSQVPFTSINFGLDTSSEGRLVTKWCLEASIAGIGKNGETPIFPISIFQHKKGINDVEGTKNFDLKQLAITSLSNRIYPNIVNCDWSQNVYDPADPDTAMMTMGCRTMIGKDRHGMGYKKIGRGNICPTTINLVKLGIKHGICLNKRRKKPDLKGFMKEFYEVLELTEKSLIDRFNYISSQSPRSGRFMYENGTIANHKECGDTVFEAIKHSTLAFGFIGINEMCQALFGKSHADDKDVLDFAVDIVKNIYDYAAEASERHDLNFGCYATPAENCCKTICSKLKEEFGVIENVTDKEYLTNSFHVPVWKKVTVFEKIDIESRFTKYATSGTITYVELDAKTVKNRKAIQSITEYAFSKDIPYLAFNFSIDTCIDCGFTGEIEEVCPKCGSVRIKKLKRVTGYLTKDYRDFNSGKIQECNQRVKHDLK